jgi:uncharacterized membrane protein YccC
MAQVQYPLSYALSEPMKLSQDGEERYPVAPEMQRGRRTGASPAFTAAVLCTLAVCVGILIWRLLGGE